MIVRCVRNRFAGHVEKRSGLHDMEKAALEVGKNYVVYGINFHQESSVFRSHVTFTVEVDIYVLAAFHERFFEVVDAEVPVGWEFSWSPETVTIQHRLLCEPSFADALFEGDVEARRRFHELAAAPTDD